MYCEEDIPKESFPEYILKRCLEHGDATALIDNWTDGQSITFKELHAQALICASYLRDHGLKKGDLVGICSPNCIEFPIVVLGITACGAAVVPCNPYFNEGEFVQELSISKPRSVFVHEEILSGFKKLCSKLTFIKDLFVIGRSDEFTTFRKILESTNGNDVQSADGSALVDVNIFDDVAYAPLSGGTTGLPKTVLLTHRNLVSMISIYCQTAPPYDDDGCFYMNRYMFHIGGFAHTIISLAVGVMIVVDRKYELERTLKAIQKYKVTHMSITPLVMIQFVHEADVQKYDISSIKELRCTGAAMSPDIISKLANKFNAKIVPSYGMTESGLISMYRDVENYITSVGTPCVTVGLKIIDPQTTTELPIGQDGEILVKGPQVMKGYLNDPESTEQHIDKEGWLHTADVGHLDESGKLYITGRMREMIKYDSYKVPPAEIESVLLKHPKVADVGVVGIPDPLAGELPKALVVKKDDRLTEDEVIGFVAAELWDYKHLRGGAQFVEAIPRSDFGKIKRAELKKIAGVQ